MAHGLLANQNWFPELKGFHFLVTTVTDVVSQIMIMQAVTSLGVPHANYIRLSCNIYITRDISVCRHQCLICDSLTFTLQEIYLCVGISALSVTL